MVVANKTLGKTPLHTTVPAGTKTFAFELRLAGYRKKAKQIAIGGTSNTVNVPLDRVPAVVRPHPREPTPGNDNDLMRP